MTLPRQPREHGLSRRDAARLARGNAELDERDEAPVGTTPFRVRMPSETAVLLLAGQESAHLGTAHDMLGLGWVCVTEEIALRLGDDPGLVRTEQPVDRSLDNGHPPRLLRGRSRSTSTCRRRPRAS